MIRNKVYRFILFAALLSAFFLASCATHSAIVQDEKRTTLSPDGSRIAYGFRGEGEPAIVFVHGWLCEHSVWQFQIDHFSRKHRVIWLDLAGHGESMANRRQFTMAAFAQDVLSVVNAAGGEKIVLVGHSMGGPIVIEAAKKLGKRVAGIVGVDAFYTPLANVPEEAKLAFWEKLKSNYPQALKVTISSMFTQNADPDLVDSTYVKMLAADHDMGISALYECIKWNAHKEPLELKAFADVLYNINGSPADNEEVTHESVVLISDAGHFMFQVKPNRFNKQLESIVQRLDYPSPHTKNSEMRAVR